MPSLQTAQNRKRQVLTDQSRPQEQSFHQDVPQSKASSSVLCVGCVLVDGDTTPPKTPMTFMYGFSVCEVHLPPFLLSFMEGTRAQDVSPSDILTAWEESSFETE